MLANFAAWDRGTQQTFIVLHTLRSRECSIVWASTSGSACSDTTIHAPPVPCRLTGTPCCRATAPSWATAVPDPRATARASRWSENNAQPAAWAAESTNCTLLAGKPAWRSAGSTHERMIWRAVPRASLPILNTAVLPVRSTPVASANTLGRPSNTNPTTPRGPRHDDPPHPPRGAPRHDDTDPPS